MIDAVPGNTDIGDIKDTALKIGGGILRKPEILEKTHDGDFIRVTEFQELGLVVLVLHFHPDEVVLRYHTGVIVRLGEFQRVGQLDIHFLSQPDIFPKEKEVIKILFRLIDNIVLFRVQFLLGELEIDLLELQAVQEGEAQKYRFVYLQ